MANTANNFYSRASCEARQQYFVAKFTVTLHLVCMRKSSVFCSDKTLLYLKNQHLPGMNNNILQKTHIHQAIDSQPVFYRFSINLLLIIREYYQSPLVCNFLSVYRFYNIHTVQDRLFSNVLIVFHYIYIRHRPTVRNT